MYEVFFCYFHILGLEEDSERELRCRVPLIFDFGACCNAVVLPTFRLQVTGSNIEYTAINVALQTDVLKVYFQQAVFRSFLAKR